MLVLLGSLECIHGWAPELRAEFLQQLGVSQQFVLQILIQRLELDVELFVEEDGPIHGTLWLSIHMVSSP